MFYFGYKFVKFFVELPTFDCKICLFSLKITPFYYPKTKFKHTLNDPSKLRLLQISYCKVYALFSIKYCLFILRCLVRAFLLKINLFVENVFVNLLILSEDQAKLVLQTFIVYRRYS